MWSYGFLAAMHEWPTTVAFTDAEAAALARVAEAQFGGDRDAAVRAMLESWLDEHGDRPSRFRR